MPLCGFNKKMIDGIITFSEGLFEATIQRGKQNRVDDFTAVRTEVHEIDLFIKAFRDKYKTPEDTSKKMAEMIYGVAVFSGGLFQSILARNGHATSDFATTFQNQVKEIGLFLERLESKHQELKKTNTPEQTMAKAVQWVDDNDK
jgi:hypothetical protein